MWVRRCLNAWTRPCFVCGSSGARTSSADLVIPQRTRRSPLFIKKYTLSVANGWCPGSIVAVNGMALLAWVHRRTPGDCLGCSVRGRRVVHSQATTQFLTTDSPVAGTIMSDLGNEIMADGFWQVGLWQQSSDAPYLYSRFRSVFSVKLLIERPNIALVTRGDAKIDYGRPRARV
jgi:hypothetical protein